MNTIKYATVRSIFGVILGFLLVLWPENAVRWLVITIGILFILPGIYSLLHYFIKGRDENHSRSVFPVEGAGSILLGIWLIIMPEFFINILMYVLGALMVIAGIQQIIHLAQARKWAIVGWGYYVIPIFIFIAGILILIYPFGVAVNTFVLLGVISIIYGFNELINAYKFRQKKEQFIIINEEEGEDAKTEKEESEI